MAKVEQSWEPGTLDKTRQNIGVLSEEEAKKMTQILGGEILQEKSAPIDYKSMPNYQIFSKKVVGKSANEGSEASAAQYAATASKPEKKFELPVIDSKEKALFDKLMMDSEYKIKTSYGIFNFFLRFTGNKEALKSSFVEYTITKDVEHLNEFIMAIKNLVQIAPASYKECLMYDNETLEDKYVFMKVVGSWSLKEIKYSQSNLQSHPENATVLSTKDFIKSIYKLLIKIYYLGENKIPELLEEIYTDLVKFPKVNKKQVGVIVKTGITEWFYVYSKVIKGLYPLLMRLCCKHCENFHDFFVTKTADIFKFLEVTKYDLMLPNRKIKQKEEVVAQKKEEVKDKKEETEKKPNPESNYVNTGLNLLNMLFPEAGFNKLSSFPDMYPYFQPLYQFNDGFNLLAKENPLQITITLLRITEDFLRGCRNIKFTDDAEFFFTEEQNKLSTILAQWSLYRENLFEKLYGDNIREFVNAEYSNPGDFRKSQYGLKLQTQMLWQTQYYFLPYFKFQQLILDKPKNDNPYTPLCIRSTQLRKIFTSLVKTISQAEKEKTRVIGIENPWDKYKFDIPTPVSKRLDVILGAKKSLEETKATNANLLKHTLCVISVLDWWLNNKESPAYNSDSSKIYRISEKDGAPEFSVPLLENQTELFKNALKAKMQKSN